MADTTSNKTYSVMVDSGGVLKYPQNFITANQLISSGVFNNEPVSFNVIGTNQLSVSSIIADTSYGLELNSGTSDLMLQIHNDNQSKDEFKYSSAIYLTNLNDYSVGASSEFAGGVAKGINLFSIDSIHINSLTPDSFVGTLGNITIGHPDYVMSVSLNAAENLNVNTANLNISSATLKLNNNTTITVGDAREFKLDTGTITHYASQYTFDGYSHQQTAIDHIITIKNMGSGPGGTVKFGTNSDDSGNQFAEAVIQVKQTNIQSYETNIGDATDGSKINMNSDVYFTAGVSLPEYDAATDQFNYKKAFIYVYKDTNGNRTLVIADDPRMPSQA